MNFKKKKYIVSLAFERRIRDYTGWNELSRKQNDKDVWMKKPGEKQNYMLILAKRRTKEMIGISPLYFPVKAIFTIYHI